MNIRVFLFFFFNIFATIEEDCFNWDDKYTCKTIGDYEIPSSWDERGFQTPPRNDIYGRHKETYQDMHYLVGYAQLKYSLDKQICTIKFITKVNPKLGKEGENYYIRYIFGNIYQESNIFVITPNNNTYNDGMPISARIYDSRTQAELVKLELEEEYFIWDNPTITQSSHYENGQKGGIVELFGWPYEDIAEECEFISHAGYMGIKIFSPNEHLENFKNIEDEMLNPWWYISQPVSYKLHSRMGNKKQLKNMINICRSYNLRIYADIIINHMTSSGYDMYDDHRNGNESNCFHWNEKGSTAGSPFWNIGYRYENNSYTGLEPGLEYPSVPYFPSDFHCKSTITNWQDSGELNGGWISDLADLNTEKENVQQRIADYLVELLSVGFSGFSIENAKHIYPKSFVSIFKKLKENLGGGFPQDFISILQLLFGFEKQILICEEKVSSFGVYFTKLLESEGFSNEEINKIKIWNSGFPQENPVCDDNIWRITPERHAISLENPDDINQGNYYYTYIRDKDIERHRNLTIDMFSNYENNWKIKSVFSMFSVINGSTGFPDGNSDCSKCPSEICNLYCRKSVPYQKAYNPKSVGYDTGNAENWKEGTYTRVHRDLRIVNSMRKWMGLATMTEDELFNIEKQKMDCDEKCLTCNNESKIEDKCLICNKSRGFYPIVYPGHTLKYYKCLNSSLEYDRFYLDKEEKVFKPCYESCRKCDREGDGINHNCISCDVDLIERPRANTYLKNCVGNCSHSYYETEYGQYKCVEIPFCPIEANKYIKEKNKCIDDCKNDDTYRYLYNGICIINCPNHTFESNFLCMERNYQICTLSEREIFLNNFEEENGMSSVIKSYIDEFSYTKKHVSLLNNKDYKLVIYRDSNCLKELSLKNKIDFVQCYEKVKSAYNISEDLIIVYIEKNNIDNPILAYSLYDPKSGEKLNAEIICKQESIVIEKNISYFFSDKSSDEFNEIKSLIDQGINLLDPDDPFFNDVCFHFESPNKRDMTLKDRVLTFYPNISLCDPGCEYEGLNLTTFTSKCFCRFNDIINIDLLKDNIIFEENINEIIEIIDNSNVEVLKCFKFTFKYFNKSFGGFLIIFATAICIAFTFVFYFRNLKSLENYIRELTKNYILFLQEKDNDKSYSSCNEKNKEGITIINEDKINDINNNDLQNNIDKNKDDNIKIYSIKNKSLKINNNSINSKNILNNSINKLNIFINEIKIEKNKYELSVNRNTINSKEIILNNNLKNNIKLINDKSSVRKKGINLTTNLNDFFSDYLAVSLDDLDFEDALKKDKRSFCQFFGDSIIEKQMLFNVICESEPLRPFSLKMILLILKIVLYFVVNGIFYSEDYISEIYHSENEAFFTFFSRSINRFVYTTIVSIFISFLIDCFFYEEKKIKGIFKREKENIPNLKCEINIFIKKVKKMYFSFIVVIFFLYFCFWVYLLCFNYVYPNTQNDWIKSSVVIIIIMQIIQLLISLTETLLRFISFFCKSEKIFRVSKLLD